MSDSTTFFETAVETYNQLDSKLIPMFGDYSENVKKIDPEKVLSAFDIVLQYSLLDTALTERKLIEDEAKFIQRIARHGSLVKYLSRQTGMNWTWNSLYRLTEDEIARIIAPFSQKVVNNAIDMSNVLIDIVKILGETEGQKFFTYVCSKIVHVIMCLIFLDDGADNSRELEKATESPIFVLLNYVADNARVKIPSYEEMYELNFGEKPPHSSSSSKESGGGASKGGSRSSSTSDSEKGKGASLRPSGSHGGSAPKEIIGPKGGTSKEGGRLGGGGEDSSGKSLVKPTVSSSSRSSSSSDFYVKKSADEKYKINYEQKELGVAFVETDTGTGSGFVINETGLVFTCNHVIEGSKYVYIYLMDKDENKHKYEGKVVYFDADNDRACVQIMGCSDKFYYFDIEEDYKSIKSGDDVAVFGYPYGVSLSESIEELAPTLTKGYIGSKNKVNGKSCYYLDIRSAPGYSGGPTFRIKDNKVIGYLCGSYGSDRANLVYIRPLQDFLKFFK